MNAPHVMWLHEWCRKNGMVLNTLKTKQVGKQVGFLQKRNPIRGVQYFPIPIAMNIK